MEGTEVVLQIVSQLGVAAVLGWYLYYTTTVSFPKAHDKMLDRVDKLQEKQAAVIETVCTDFTCALREERAEMREERAARREELRMLREDLRCPRGPVDQEP